ncbi:MAG: peptide deformylase [Desulfuromonas sp.]|nr:MAG: peptide deformylase [Desulfuromonas sp.]
MSILRILHYPDPVLSTRAEPIDQVTDEVRKLAEDMAETMYAAPGVGLAAPQIGVSERLIVLDCAAKDEPPNLIKAVNPEIVAAEGECFEEEGCLSVPAYYARVKRKAAVKVRFTNMNNEVVAMETDGLLAIAFQHEIDHLDGVLFVDHLSSLKKGMFKKKYQKILEQLEEQL